MKMLLASPNEASVIS